MHLHTAGPAVSFTVRLCSERLDFALGSMMCPPGFVKCCGSQLETIKSHHPDRLPLRSRQQRHIEGYKDTLHCSWGDANLIWAYLGKVNGLVSMSQPHPMLAGPKERRFRHPQPHGLSSIPSSWLFCSLTYATHSVLVEARLIEVWRV